MKGKTRKFYLKPSTEVFFVESVQLMLTSNKGDHNEVENPEPGKPIVIGEEEAKGFFGFGDDNDFESEKIFSTETSWDD